MLGFEARHVVSSSTSRRVLFGAFEHSVVIRDLVHGTQSETIHTTFDFGGRRLALSDELDGILAAAYDRYGLALYTGNTGHEVWRRKDIRKVQDISLSPDGLTAYCGMEAAPLAVIDLRTGDTKRRVRGVRFLCASPYAPVQFADSSRPFVADARGNHLFYVDRVTFAVLDVVFAPDLLVLSESGGPVRCIVLATGHEKWRYDPPKGSHVLRVGYHEERSCVLGVEWPYAEGGPKRLLQFSPEHGAIVGALDVCELTDCCFALAGRVLVTTEGEVIDTATGERRLNRIRGFQVDRP